VATEIGRATGTLTATVSAALVAAGLLSAALFPVAAARMLARAGHKEEHSARAADSAEGRHGEVPSSPPGSEGRSAYRSLWLRPSLSVQRAARRLRRTDT
jgi:multidrug efflux pump subunit AcrB